MVFSMSDYNKIDDDVQTFSDDDHDLIPVELKPVFPISRAIFTNPVLRRCIHKRLSKVWQCEILMIASCDDIVLSKSLAKRREL